MAAKGGAIRWTPDQLKEYRQRTEHDKNLRARRILDNVVIAPPVPKPSKYRAEKVEQDGENFDSRKEARRWAELLEMEQAGQISELRRQVSFELIPKQIRADGKAERACAYVADFAYVRGGLHIVEDAKGFRTRDYIIKRKLMLRVHGITIIEV